MGTPQPEALNLDSIFPSPGLCGPSLALSLCLHPGSFLLPSILSPATGVMSYVRFFKHRAAAHGVFPLIRGGRKVLPRGEHSKLFEISCLRHTLEDIFALPKNCPRRTHAHSRLFSVSYISQFNLFSSHTCGGGVVFWGKFIEIENLHPFKRTHGIHSSPSVCKVSTPSSVCSSP